MNIRFLSLCLLAVVLCPPVFAQRPGVPDAGTFQELYDEVNAQPNHPFSASINDLFSEWRKGPWAWRPGSHGNIGLTLIGRPNKSRWSEVDLPFVYWATTPDKNHNNGKYRMNVTRRGVTRSLSYTVTVNQFDVDQTVSQAWATASQTHGTPSFDDNGKVRGTMGNTLTIQIRMDGKNQLRGSPHWVVRVNGKMKPFDTFSKFETKIIERPLKLMIGAKVRWHVVQRFGLDGSDGFPPGKSWVAYSLPGATDENGNDISSRLFVVVDHVGPNMMAVRDEPNTGPYRDRLGIYRHPAWLPGTIEMTFEDVEIEYRVDPYLKAGAS